MDITLIETQSPFSIVSGKTGLSITGLFECQSPFAIEQNKNKYYRINNVKNHEEFDKIMTLCVSDISEIMSNLQVAYDTFDEVKLPSNLITRITEYIDNIDCDMQSWKYISQRIDQTFCNYRTRKLPYFNSVNDDWKQSNMKLLESYSEELKKALDIKEKKEAIIVKKINTYDHSVLYQPINPENYDNLDKWMSIISCLYKLKLYSYVLILISKLLCRKESCHIVKKVDIWSIIKKFSKCDDIYKLMRYYIFYAMYNLKREEELIKDKYKLSDTRCIFSITEAANFAKFSTYDIRHNPHVICMTGNIPINKCIPFYIPGNRSINNLDLFIKRFNIVTGGAFRGIHLKSLNVSISGSILIPCAHTSPLEQLFVKSTQIPDRKTPEYKKYKYMVSNIEDIEFLNYIEQYYPGYASLDDNDFSKLFIPRNDLMESNVIYEDEASPRQESAVLISHDEPSGFDNLADIDVAVTAKTNDDYESSVGKLYAAICENCKNRGPVYVKRVITKLQYKYNFYGPGLTRSMDVFKTPEEPHILVKNYHVAPVRMFYNGEDVYMYRSCIASLLTGVGDSYKWFSCNKTPADIILKYIYRGISLVFNAREIETISEYVRINDKWKFIYNLYSNNFKKIYSAVSIYNPLFHQSDNTAGHRMYLRVLFYPPKGTFNNTFAENKTSVVLNENSLENHSNNRIIPPNINIIYNVFRKISNETWENLEKNKPIEKYVLIKEKNDNDGIDVEFESILKENLFEELNNIQERTEYDIELLKKMEDPELLSKSSDDSNVDSDNDNDESEFEDIEHQSQDLQE